MLVHFIKYYKHVNGLFLLIKMEVFLLCLIAIQVTADDERFYKTEIRPGDHQRSAKSESVGFAEPLDFSSFSQQFFQQDNKFPLPAAQNAANFDFFGAESKDNQKKMSFPMGGGLNYQFSFSELNPISKTSTPRKARAEEFRPSKRDPLNSVIGKSNYPSPAAGHKSDHSPLLPAPVYANSEDIEVFFPPDRAILPQLNGRPRPYDGYRTADKPDYESPTLMSNPSRQKGYRSEPESIEDMGPVNRPTKRQNPTGTKVMTSRPASRRPYKDHNGGQGHIEDKRNQFKRHYPARGYDDRRPQRFYNNEPAESRYDSAEHEEPDERIVESSERSSEEEDEGSSTSLGYKYQLDDSVNIPDLVIKKYPYERQTFDDGEYTREYEKFTKSLESDLEKKFGTPDYDVERYTVAATENLAKNGNCKKIESEESKSCYICQNPESGGTYEQCAYENEPKSEKYVYRGEKFEKEKSRPIKYRYKRSLEPTEFDYFVYGGQINDAIEKDRQDKKRKSKKYKSSKKVKKPHGGLAELKRPSYMGERLTLLSSPYEVPSSPYEGSFSSLHDGSSSLYDDPSSSYEDPSSSYEGSSLTYEGPKSSYEGPSFPYEGPDHDDYYDHNDDRIPHKSNEPLLSIFDDEEETKMRFRRGPKDEVEEFGPDDESVDGLSVHSYHDYRFGPEFFLEDKKPKTRKVIEKVIVEEVDTPTQKVFKNGDICVKKRKKDMICMVCNNEKSGAQYQQCQYSKKPNSQAYSYGSEKSYSSNKPKNPRPQRQTDQEPQISERKYVYTQVQKRVFDEDSQEEDENAEKENRKDNVDKKRENVTLAEELDKTSRSDNFPFEFDQDSEDEGSEDIKSLEKIPGSTSYEVLGQTSGNSNSKLFPQTNESFEQYFSRVFPQFEVFGKLSPSVLGPVADLENLSELPGLSDQAEVVAGSPVYFDQKPSGDHRQFSQAFDKFQAKDWSNCVKNVREKLVCYECPSQQGIIHEECMYMENPTPAKPSMADILTAVQSAIETGKKAQIMKETNGFKGDFSGTGGKLEETQKTKNAKLSSDDSTDDDDDDDDDIEEADLEEHHWESSKKPFAESLKDVDMSQVKIFFNNTESRT